MSDEIDDIDVPLVIIKFVEHIATQKGRGDLNDAPGPQAYIATQLLLAAAYLHADNSKGVEHSTAEMAFLKICFHAIRQMFEEDERILNHLKDRIDHMHVGELNVQRFTQH